MVGGGTAREILRRYAPLDDCDTKGASCCVACSREASCVQWQPPIDKRRCRASSRGHSGPRDLACSAETFWGCAMVRLKLITPTRCQIIPFWIEARNQGNLLAPRPSLNLLLPLDGS